MYFNYGQGFDQGVSVTQVNGTWTLLFGEIPRGTTQGIVMFKRRKTNNITESCFTDDIFIASKCIEKHPQMTLFDLLSQDSLSIHFPTYPPIIVMGNYSFAPGIYGSPLTGALVPSGYKFTLPTRVVVFNNDTYVMLMPRGVGNKTNLQVPLSTFLGVNSDLDMVAFHMPPAKYVRPMSDCDNFAAYLNSSRYIVYDNWRITRYAIDIFVAIIAALTIYYSSEQNVVQDRLFGTCIVIVASIIYGVAGLCFIAAGIEFQSVEYLFYMTVSVVYFSNFVRYAVRKMVQEKTFDFFSNTNAISNDDTTVGGAETSLKDLKKKTMASVIDKNDLLSSLVKNIPKEMINALVLWAIIILGIVPFIEILIFDVKQITPYANFMLSVTIGKFAGPITSTFTPATVVFALIIIGHIRNMHREKAAIGDTTSAAFATTTSPDAKHRNSITRHIISFFETFEDPLLYRAEFTVCVITCLPFAIFTFVIGNVDAVIPSYIFGRRIILLCFHGICYIIFDVTYIIMTSGLFAVVWQKILLRAVAQDDGTSTIGTAITMDARVARREMSNRKLTVKAVLEHAVGKDLIADYCKVTNNYNQYGLRKWLCDIRKSPDLNNRLVYFFKAYAVRGRSGMYDDFVTLAQSLRVIMGDTYNFSEFSKLSAEETSIVLENLIEIIETHMIKMLLFDGLTDTLRYSYFLDDYEDYITEYKMTYLAAKNEAAKVADVIADLGDVELQDTPEIRTSFAQAVVNDDNKDIRDGSSDEAMNADDLTGSVSPGSDMLALSE